MKYRDEYGNWQEIYLEALDDGLPIGTLVNYNGDDADIPSNWEKIAEDISTGIKVLRKTSQTTPTNATIINEYSESQTDAYSVNYVNNIVDNFDDTTGDLDDLNTTDKSNLVNAINEVNTRSIISVGTNADVTVPSAGAIKVVDMNNLISQTGDTQLLYMSNNRVNIGAGVSKVLVSGKMMISGSGTTRNGYVYKNGEECLLSMHSGLAANSNLTISLTPRIVEVQEGDYFQLAFYGGANGDRMSYGTARSYLTIEVIE